MCTTIRLTQLPFKDLYDWDGASEFVADYLNFKALEPAHEIVSDTLYLPVFLYRLFNRYGYMYSSHTKRYQICFAAKEVVIADHSSEKTEGKLF